MKNLLIFTAVLALFCGTVALAASGAALDGKTFNGETIRPGSPKGDPDTFIFKDGTFRSTACDKYGYGPAGYTAKTGGGAINFESTTQNTHGAKIDWKGSVKGGEITGSAVMTAKSGSKESFDFKGKLGS